MAEYWLKCTSCKKELAFGAVHWVCSVSTCNRSRFPLKFCSVICWDIHLADARHRDAGAIEARAPTRDAWQREQAADARPTPAPPPAAAARTPSPPPAAATRPPTVPGVAAVPAAAIAAPRPAAPSAGDSVPRPVSSETTRVGPAPAPTSPAAPRRVVGDASPVSAAAVEGVTLSEVVDRDILVVVSKMKKYIRDRSGMNCSDAVADALSDHVRLLCDEAIRSAGRDERKTVLDRDVARPRR